MVNLHLTVTIRSEQYDDNRAQTKLENFARFFRQQCCPGFLPDDFWSESPFVYYPDENAERSGLRRIDAISSSTLQIAS